MEELERHHLYCVSKVIPPVMRHFDIMHILLHWEKHKSTSVVLLPRMIKLSVSCMRKHQTNPNSGICYKIPDQHWFYHSPSVVVMQQRKLRNYHRLEEMVKTWTKGIVDLRLDLEPKKYINRKASDNQIKPIFIS